VAREPATSLCGPRHRFHSANFLHNSGGSRARAMDRSGQGGMADIFARRLSNSLLVALEFISITTWTSVMTSLRFLFQSRTIDAKGISTPSLLCGHQKQTVGNTQPVRNGNDGSQRCQKVSGSLADLVTIGDLWESIFGHAYLRGLHNKSKGLEKSSGSDETESRSRPSPSVKISRLRPLLMLANKR